MIGPANPFSKTKQVAARNMMSGFTEEHFMDDASFNNMKRTFDTHGYTVDPSATHTGQIVGDLSASRENNG